jgi:hypothetical protein
MRRARLCCAGTGGEKKKKERKGAKGCLTCEKRTKERRIESQCIRPASAMTQGVRAVWWAGAEHWRMRGQGLPEIWALVFVGVRHGCKINVALNVALSIHMSVRARNMGITGYYYF